MAKYSKKAQEKIGEVMHEFKEGNYCCCVNNS